ncbi:MAG TPA: YebC/PmpR family DNA-binding transcriptional regulator [Chthoniobacter sp.]|jgi:YebC/PmpR family DNA-binding regulatory protein
MAGHSKWSKVKHIKGPLDQKRGQLFSKLAKEITVAAKMGGGDPSGNPRLRCAILTARAQSMPNDNIDRAIKRGSGEGTEATNIEESVYEAYAPGGVALLVEVATDNRNRTAADLRLVLTKNHGNLASTGAVSYMFHRKGRITVPAAAIEEERLLGLVIEAGGDELTQEEDHHVISTAGDRLYAVAEALRAAGVQSDAQKLTFVPETNVTVGDPAVASQVVRLIEALEDSDDVQHVHSNFAPTEEALAQLTV